MRWGKTRREKKPSVWYLSEFYELPKSKRKGNSVLFAGHSQHSLSSPGGPGDQQPIVSASSNSQMPRETPAQGIIFFPLRGGSFFWNGPWHCSWCSRNCPANWQWVRWKKQPLVLGIHWTNLHLESSPRCPASRRSHTYAHSHVHSCTCLGMLLDI